MIDLLHLPAIGPALRARRTRLVLQGVLLAVAALILYDGFTGPPMAPRNLATVLAWIHYRGLVVLALLLAGNLFCMACPFHLTRSLAVRLSRRGRRWPAALRNKWTAIAALFLIFWLYEWLDLWASPWLTAWVAVAYFVLSFALDALFAESPFCKYVCPLGTFNYTLASVSPLQITARDAARCRTCAGHECVNGSAEVAGCPTELYVPQIRSNLDCLFCLDCARACPHDNVALRVRAPLAELRRADAWPLRLDVALLAPVLAFTALGNAFGMVPPVYALEDALARLGLGSEGLRLLLIFAGLDVLLPLGLGGLAAWASTRLAGEGTPRLAFARLAPAVLPLGFAIWLAHYGFHFATSAAGLLPAGQDFLLRHGLLSGLSPDWTRMAILPRGWVLPLQVAAVVLGFAGSLRALTDRARQTFPGRPHAVLPWVLLCLLLAWAAVVVFSLPMEMRGTMMMMGG